MYDLLDIQTLFSTSNTTEIVKSLLESLNIRYSDHTTLLKLDNCNISYIHNRILVFRDSQPMEILFSNNREHLHKLSHIIQQSK